MTVPFIMEPFKGQDRTGFACGNDRIDKYFRERLSGEIKSGYARCQVAIHVETGKIAGFYTLSSQHIPLRDLPDELKRKLPRYEAVPSVLIGWLGRHTDYRGQRLGSLLLVHAIRTVHLAQIGAYAILADPIDAEAMVFYRPFGFRPLSDIAETDKFPRLFLPMKDATALIPKKVE